MSTPAPVPRIEHDLPCPYCRYNLRSQQPGGICPECGNAIPPAPRTLAGFIPCPRCGKENLARSPLCVYCRTPLPAYVLPPRLRGTVRPNVPNCYGAPLILVASGALLLIRSLLPGGGITWYRAAVGGYLLVSLVFLWHRWRTGALRASPTACTCPAVPEKAGDTCPTCGKVIAAKP